MSPCCLRACSSLIMGLVRPDSCRFSGVRSKVALTARFWDSIAWGLDDVGGCLSATSAGATTDARRFGGYGL